MRATALPTFSVLRHRTQGQSAPSFRRMLLGCPKSQPPCTGRGCRRSVPHRLTKKTLKTRQHGCGHTRRSLLPDSTPRSSASCSSAERGLISAELQLPDDRGVESCQRPRRVSCHSRVNTPVLPGLQRLLRQSVGDRPTTTPPKPCKPDHATPRSGVSSNKLCNRGNIGPR